MSRSRQWVYRLVGLFLLLTVWEAVGRSALLADNVLPPPTRILAELPKVLTAPGLDADVTTTLYQLALGLLLGYGIGLTLGVLIASSRILYAAAEPILYSLGAVPKIVLLPLLVLFFGAGTGSKIGIAAVSALFPVAVSTATALRGVPRHLVDAARLLGASGPKLWLNVYLPALLGPILSGLRIGLGVATTGTLLAEMSIAQQGLGLRAAHLYAQLQIEQLYALLLLIFICVVVLNTLLDSGIRRLTGATTSRAKSNPFG